MQDDQLFVGTIEDNISFFDTEHDPARVRECARSAMIDEEIMAMPMQYNTIVGSLGMALSGGQKAAGAAGASALPPPPTKASWVSVNSTTADVTCSTASLSTSISTLLYSMQCLPWI
jgi:hypothetical protein